MVVTMPVQDWRATLKYGSVQVRVYGLATYFHYPAPSPGIAGLTVGRLWLPVSRDGPYPVAHRGVPLYLELRPNLPGSKYASLRHIRAVCLHPRDFGDLWFIRGGGV